MLFAFGVDGRFFGTGNHFRNRDLNSWGFGGGGGGRGPGRRAKDWTRFRRPDSCVVERVISIGRPALIRELGPGRKKVSGNLSEPSLVIRTGRAVVRGKRKMGTAKGCCFLS